jgi:hypothetical protein
MLAGSPRDRNIARLITLRKESRVIAPVGSPNPRVKPWPEWDDDPMSDGDNLAPAFQPEDLQ